ncbi:MAG: 2Fe-2S iron-sulfur cluster binding domain-containing protein [Myxococcales bacterium]|nr:2Fe-2S iron-sulfur cluster binding domain-containing protein [Myxococcales bacterium]
MAIIRFIPQNVEIEVCSETSVLAAAQKAGLSIATICNGKASCSECRIKIHDGEDNMSPIVFKEKEHLGNLYFITKERLACQTFAVDGVLSVEILRAEIESKRERSRRKALARSKENAKRLAERHAEKKARELPPEPKRVEEPEVVAAASAGAGSGRRRRRRSRQS